MMGRLLLAVLSFAFVIYRGRGTGLPEWSECSTTCGDGMRIRELPCEESDTDCDPEMSMQLQMCNHGPCPGLADWAGWSHWSECSRTCDMGVRWRMRACDHTHPESAAPCDGDDHQLQTCRIAVCEEQSINQSASNYIQNTPDISEVMIEIDCSSGIDCVPGVINASELAELATTAATFETSTNLYPSTTILALGCDDTHRHRDKFGRMLCEETATAESVVSSLVAVEGAEMLDEEGINALQHSIMELLSHLNNRGERTRPESLEIDIIRDSQTMPVITPSPVTEEEEEEATTMKATTVEATTVKTTTVEATTVEATTVKPSTEAPTTRQLDGEHAHGHSDHHDLAGEIAHALDNHNEDLTWNIPADESDTDNDVGKQEVGAVETWSHWLDWSSCFGGCTGGHQTRFRMCLSQGEDNSDDNPLCGGQSSQTQTCISSDLDCAEPVRLPAAAWHGQFGEQKQLVEVLSVVLMGAVLFVLITLCSIQLAQIIKQRRDEIRYRFSDESLNISP